MGFRFSKKKPARGSVRAFAQQIRRHRYNLNLQVVPVASTTFYRLCQPLKFCICCVIVFSPRINDCVKYIPWLIVRQPQIINYSL